MPLYDVSEPLSLHLKFSHNFHQDIRRIGSVTDIQILGEMTPACPLHLLEIDIAHLGWGKPTSSPSSDSFAGAPQVDGVLICYDATAQSSFTHVEDLLSKFLSAFFTSRMT